MTGRQLLLSPHFDARPSDAEIDLIVLHAISLPPGCFEPEPVIDLFLGRLACDHPKLREIKGLRVSAHFLVDRGGRIYQFVPVKYRAWHAGQSSWAGRQRCNDFSIGIEMIGDEQRPFTRAQYQETARLCRVLMQRFPAITPDRIVGHQDVAPGRKWDPGVQWNWARFFRSLARIRRLDLEVV